VRDPPRLITPHRGSVTRPPTETTDRMTMTARTFTAALIAFSLMLPATAVHAERSPDEQVQPVKKKGKFRLFGGMKRQEEAVTDEARAEVKAAVAEQVAAPKKGRIWCVPFARAVTGIEIKGNAATWWKQAADRYARGQEPQVGAVMNFRASRAMPMGHVAVVSKIVSEREILVDQANWERNRITEDTLVVDVSAKNDWSEVRVANSGGTLGRTNPVYGFIYR